MTDRKIGFIGMGIMGKPMAVNLLKAGYAVTVHSRTKARAEAAIKAGAVWADSCAAVAEKSDVVICCVPDTPDVEKVLLGKDGAAEGSREGTICIDCSTISPAVTVEMGRKLAEKNIHLLDAPISGGEIGAIEGKLSIMMGGEKKLFEQVKPIMSAMGRSVVHCGPLGYGQRTKLANQIMVIHTLMSVAEGLAFAEKAGLDPETTWQVTSAGAAGSRALTVLGKRIIEGDMRPGFMVDLQMKDLRLVMEYAEEIGQPLPGVALAKQLLSVLQSQGRGRDGIQALVDVIRQLGNTRN